MMKYLTMKYLTVLFAAVALVALAHSQQVAQPLGPNGIACAYNASPPTLITGNAGWVQCDSTGHLLTSGGGGGAVTAALGAFVDGAIATLGLKSDTANIAAGNTLMAAIRQLDADVVTLNTTAGNPLAAGSAVIGKAGIDQTTLGTTNGVALVGVNGATALAGAGAVGTGAPRVAVGQDTSTVAGSPPDPCQANAKTNVPIATSSASTELAVLAVGKKTYICSFAIMSAGAAVINIVEGTGSGVCTGGTPVADLGSTTAANGMSLAANGGLTYGNGGSTVIGGTTAAYNVCLVQSGTAALAGNLTYVQQ
ncbi:MAG: hypothetical protein P4L50_00325 [Anaerolineaceae bacterium]|nr:hypothetical protein [Anaerolineaceae bacterium]